MNSNRRLIADAVTRVGHEFLDNPTRALTLAEVAGGLQMDLDLCEAVLATLLDARVLAKTPDGAYIRFFPSFAPGTGWFDGAPSPSVRHAPRAA